MIRLVAVVADKDILSDFQKMEDRETEEVTESDAVLKSGEGRLSEAIVMTVSESVAKDFKDNDEELVLVVELW